MWSPLEALLSGGGGGGLPEQPPVDPCPLGGWPVGALCVDDYSVYFQDQPEVGTIAFAATSQWDVELLYRCVDPQG